MKNCKALESDGFYIFRSRATANSAYFEDEQDVIRFVGIIRSKFHRVMRVYDYLCREGGWILAVKLLDETTIREEFMRYKEQEAQLWEPWRIISELMRHSLSQYVKGFNRRHGRTGTGVHSRYERYQFGSKRELLEYLGNIRKGTQEVCQNNNKYRPVEKLYHQLARLGKTHAIICSKDKDKERGMLVGFWGELLDFQIVTSHVVEDWMMKYKKTKILHPSP